MIECVSNSQYKENFQILSRILVYSYKLNQIIFIFFLNLFCVLYFHHPIVNYKESRPRNLGRGVSKPKKNTVASLLAQSRAVGLKPILSTQQLLSQGADLVSQYRFTSNKTNNFSNDNFILFYYENF